MTTIEIGNHVVHYVDNPSSSSFSEPEPVPLLLLHGVFNDSTMWENQVEFFTHQGFRVITIDLPGHGQSAVQPLSSITDLTDISLRVLDHLDIERVTWCGSSIGGLEALDAAIRYPERVESLVLIGVDADEESKTNKLRNSLWKQVSSAFGVKTMVTMYGKTLFSASSIHRKSPAVELWKEKMTGFRDLPSWGPMLEADALLHKRHSMLPLMSSISHPCVLLVRGAEDSICTSMALMRMQKRIKGSTIATIPKASQMVAVENPEPLNVAIMQHIAQFD